MQAIIVDFCNTYSAALTLFCTLAAYFGGQWRMRRKQAKEEGMKEGRAEVAQEFFEKNDVAHAVRLATVEERITRLETAFGGCQSARSSHFEGYNKLLCVKIRELEKRLMQVFESNRAEAKTEKMADEQRLRQYIREELKAVFPGKGNHHKKK